MSAVKLSRFLSIYLLIIMTGCGYYIGDSEEGSTCFTLSIPYFSGDQNGYLTDAMIQACAQSPSFHYVDKGGKFMLSGEVCDVDMEEIGYAYDRRPRSGKRRNLLIPIEGKRIVKVNISLIDRASGKVIYGPFTVEASSDFDFINPDSPKDATFSLGETILFSLGQLDSRYGAEDAVSIPVYRLLAQKVFWGLENLPLFSSIDSCND